MQAPFASQSPELLCYAPDPRGWSITCRYKRPLLYVAASLMCSLLRGLPILYSTQLMSVVGCRAGPLAGLSTPNVVEVPEGFGEVPGPADVLAPAPAEVLEAQSGCDHQQRCFVVLACAAAAVFAVVLT